MKRGVVELPKNGVEEWLDMDGSSSLPQPLRDKLTSLTKHHDTVGVEISEEEVELMLDNLPVPGDSSASPTLLELRQALSGFLWGLRGN